jgi:uncharacterized protein (DUF2252 family)
MRGNIDIQIRDLDQTVVGNPAYDLIRLAVSLATAARSADLPGVTTTLMVEAMIEAYSDSASSTMGRRLYFTYGPPGYLDPAIYYGFQLQFGTSIISISFL